MIRDSEEVLYKEIIVEGVLAIQEGDNPKVLRERLAASLAQKRQIMLSESDGGDGGSGKGRRARRGRKRK